MAIPQHNPQHNPDSDRERWLTEAAGYIADDLIAQHAQLTAPTVRLSIGQPTGSTTAVGQCYPRSRSTDNTNHIFISPSLSDSLEILRVLTHELIHAYLDCQDGHKGRFRSIALAVGFTPPLTSINTTEALDSALIGYIDLLGPIPHARLDTTPQKRQRGRQLKVFCSNDACGFKFHTSRMQINRIRYTECLVCDTGTLIFNE